MFFYTNSLVILINIYVEVYGCAVSQGESEIIAGLLQKAGFEIVKNIEISDIIIIVTCYVKKITEQKLLFRIEDIQKKYPDKKLIISGCMPEIDHNKVISIAPNASIVSTHHITKIAQAVQKTLKGKKVELLGESKEIKLCLPRIRKNPIVDIVPISSGCNSNCSYCCVRFAKGKLFSYPKNKILDEISSSVKTGCKEIWLTSQDNAAYELDTHERSQLPELLKKISAVDGNFFVRVGMMNPNHVIKILSELISAYNNKKIYKFLHLPVQSGDDKVLKDMNRPYSVEDFEEIVSSFNESFRFQLWTDIIVGYPTESEEQFRNTLKLIKRVKPDYVNVSRYGYRPNTPLLKTLKTEVLKERSRIASSVVRQITLEKNREWIDWRGDILISERGLKKGQWIGRNFAYKPVLINKSGSLLGKIIKVKIIDTSPTYLTGWPVNEK